MVALAATEDDLRKVFEVHLVADAGAGRDRAKVVERLLSPPQERVALPIALVFLFYVLAERLGGPKVVHLHGVVDYEVHRLQGVDALRVSAHRANRVAHRSEVDHYWHAREVLE